MAFDDSGWRRLDLPHDYSIEDLPQIEGVKQVGPFSEQCSIIIWSVGNEIKERADSSGVKIVKKLKAKVKEFDLDRPVTQAVCSLWEYMNWISNVFQIG